MAYFFEILIISLVVSSLVTAVVRQIDGGSDKMRKLKRFADNALSELNQKIDPKIKSLSFTMTDFDTKYDQAKVAVKRMEALQNEADQKAQTLGESLSQIENMKAKLDEYEKALSGLLQMTDAVEKNLNGLKEQNEVISNLSKTFDEQKANAQHIDARLNKIEDDFENANTQKIEALEQRVFAEFDGKVTSLSDSADKSLHRTEELFVSIEKTVSESFAEASRRAEKLEDAAFNALKNSFETHLEELGVSLREITAGREEAGKTLASLMQELDEYKTDMLYRFEKLKQEAPDIALFERNITDLLIHTEAQVREDFFAFSREQTGEYTNFQTEIGNRADTLSRQVNEIESTINDLQASAYENANSKIRAFETKIEGAMAERSKTVDLHLASWMDEIESKLKGEANATIIKRIEELKEKTAAFEAAFESRQKDLELRTNERIEKNFTAAATPLHNEISRISERISALGSHTAAAETQCKSLLEQNADLTSKLQHIDTQVKSFEQQTSVLEKAEKTKAEFEKSLSLLHGDIEKAEAIKPIVQSINAEFDRLKTLQTDVEQKMHKIDADRKYIQTLQTDFERLVDLEQSVKTKMTEIQLSRDAITALEVKARELSDSVAEITTRYDRLDSKNEVLARTGSDVDAAFEKLKSLEAELQLRKTEVDGMRVISDSIPKINAASDKLVNLEGIIADAEKRIQAISAERDGIRKTEERLVHLSAQADRQFEILKSIAAKDAKNLTQDNSQSSIDIRKRETVRDLAKQGWNYKEIAASVKLSVTEVELILDIPG